MALNEEKILSGKFIFVSYSHKDSAIVEKDVNALIASGVRVWFDVNMRIGEKWTEIAERTINHSNCVGVIFYNSPDAFISSAVQKEEKMAKDRSEKEDFGIWSVHLNGMGTNDIILAALQMLSNPSEYMTAAMRMQQDLFSPERLCIMHSESENAICRIYSEIAEPFGAVDNEDTFIDSARKNQFASGATDEIIFGKYIANEYFGPEQAPTSEDQRFGLQKNLIQLNGKRYNTKNLKWRVMYVADGHATLLCTQIINQMNFNDGLNFLTSVFNNVAFSDINGYEKITTRYLNDNDVKKLFEVHKENSLKLGENTSLRHWWIDEDGMTQYWKRTYSDDFSYQKGFSIFIRKGVRPVIEVPLNLVSKL